MEYGSSALLLSPEMAVVDSQEPLGVCPASCQLPELVRVGQELSKLGDTVSGLQSHPNNRGPGCRDGTGKFPRLMPTRRTSGHGDTQSTHSGPALDQLGTQGLVEHPLGVDSRSAGQGGRPTGLSQTSGVWGNRDRQMSTLDKPQDQRGRGDFYLGQSQVQTELE